LIDDKPAILQEGMRGEDTLIGTDLFFDLVILGAHFSDFLVLVLFEFGET
jgi:hypothetical protein